MDFPTIGAGMAAAAFGLPGMQLQALMSRPGLDTAIGLAMGNLAANPGSASGVAALGIAAFAKSEAGQAFGKNAVQAVTPMFNEIKNYPAVAKGWGALGEAAAQQGKISTAVSKVLPVGAEGKVLGQFCEDLLLKATSKGGGIGAALSWASSAAPGILKSLGKFAPGVGLAAAIVGALKVFANPGAGLGSKFAALLSIGGGVLTTLPGVGTVAGLAVAGVTSAVGSVAASGDKKKGWGA